MSAIIQINAGTPAASNDSITLGSTVSLYSFDAATTYQWAIVSQPAGPVDALVTPTQRGASFVASKEGSYLIRLTVDDGLPTESTQQRIAAVRELETGNRIPAIGETTENSSNDGWANPVDAVLRRVTQFTDSGVQPGVAGAAGLAVGDIVYASGVYELASGLPGARVVASWQKAFANSAPTVQGVYGVLVSSVKGGAIATNDVIAVRTLGLWQGVPGSATVGDVVYISDLGDFALMPGTLTRQIGTVCAVGASTYDVMVGPAPAEIDAPAGGDLSGAFPDPTVVGLQGDPLAATISDGFIKRNSADTAWEEVSYGSAANTVCQGNDSRLTNSRTPTGTASGDLSGTYPGPTVAKIQGRSVAATAPSSGEVLGWNGTAWAPTTNSASPTGAAGGVLAYNGTSTYPNPNGLAPVTGGDIPVFGVVNSSLRFIANSTTSPGNAAPSLGVVAGTAQILGTGGNATLQAGAGSQGGTAFVLGGDANWEVGTAGNAEVKAGSATLVGASSGTAKLIGGNGFASNGSFNATAGGDSEISGGVGGAASGVKSGANGGKVELVAGAGGSAATASTSTTGGTGGAIEITAGVGGAGAVGFGQQGNGGSVTIDGGSGLVAGTVSVATTNAESLSLGRTGKNVTTSGVNVEAAVQYSPSANTTIPVTSPTIIFTNTAGVSMTATPTLQTSLITAGTRVTLIGSTGGVQLQREGTLANSKLRLRDNTLSIFQYDVITLIYDGAFWCEVSFSNNS